MQRLTPKKYLGLLLVLSFSRAPMPVVTAAQVSGNLNVTMNVPNSCTFSTTDMLFGSYTGVQLDATATITVTCPIATTYNINQQQGINPQCCWSNRMSGPGGLLGYKVYRDAARTLLWGNTVGNDGVSGTGTGTAQSLTAYGRIPGGQFMTPGAYTDTVVIKITY